MFFSEISGSLYAWDLADEGIERILDNLQEMTDCNSVYLISLMHHEKRPLTDYFYPHNPIRKTYFPEDSRAYFHPNPSFYGRIKPLTSEKDFLRDKDWLKILIESARKRGMKTGAELSHTLIDDQRAATQFSDCIQKDIYGNRLGKLLCFNNPDAKEYVIGLFSDIATNYDVDYIQTCLIPFNSGRGSSHDAMRVLGTTLGGCFCDFCKKSASEQGIDFDYIKSALLSVADSIARPTLEQSHENALLLASNTSDVTVLMEVPELFQWLLFRRDSLTKFFKAIHSAIHAIKPDIDLRLNAYISSNQELSGLDLKSLKSCLDSIRSSDYSEQSGNMAQLEFKRRWLLSVRRAIGDEMPFLSAIGVRPKATPEIIRQGVVVSAQCGADGITMGHYDGASFSNLRAIKEGLNLIDVEYKPNQ
ncbi:MAG: hypothetical protein QG588_1769 [Candidatus Poribacteria bacterium]|nr:hypothetical protein [Candidatus Poribacteria bacterium]